MEYAQARIQARFGERPGRAAWLRLKETGEVSALLEAASRCGLQRWVAGLEERMDLHRMEIALREHLRDAIRETALWMPPAWRESVLWASHVVDLPALAYLEKGAPPLPWMRQDPVISLYLDEDAGTRRGLLDGTQRRCLFSGSGQQGTLAPVLEAWSRMWTQTWPRRPQGERASVTQILACVRKHLAEFQELDTPQRAAVLRSALEDGLERLFRINMLLPGAAFAYVVLLALDGERLRAMLVDRVLGSQGRADS